MKSTSLKFRFVAVFAAFILLSCVVISVMAAFSIVSTGEQFASQQGGPVVSKAISLIDGDKFERLVNSMDSNDPWAEETRLALLNVKQSVGCQYLFTMAKIGADYVYIIDGSCDPSDTENYSAMGDTDDVELWGDAPLSAFENGRIASSGLIKQEGWGWKISTYQGIRNSSGRIVGIVGCDFDLDAIMQSIKMKIIKISIFGILFVLLGALIVLIFSSSIFGTMKEISSAMEKISEGTADLTTKIPVKSHNELGNLAENCNKVIASLASLIGELQREGEVLTSTGRQLSTRMQSHIENINYASNGVNEIGSQILAQQERVDNVSDGVKIVESEIKNLENRINDQTAAIAESSSAIEEISANIQSVSRTVDMITSEYETLVEQSHEGSKLVESVSEQIEEISNQSANLTEANAAIAAIAEQTNLLAMNAAIEAAHAGELGKGFSVVADEIRSLAETSATQSAGIKELLEGVSIAIQGIVESSKKSSESFVSVGSKISQMDSMMKEVKSGMAEETIGVENILQTMKTLDNTTAEITAASRKMRGESNKVFDAVHELEQISSETQRKSDEITSSMEEMNAAANEAANASEVSLDATDNVVRMINGFKVN